MREKNKQYYYGLDLLRVISCFGIVLMHIKGNTNYNITEFWYKSLVSHFTDLTYLFMTISAFSLCCAYYEKYDNNQFVIDEFYKKRFNRIWPTFAILCSLELIISPSLKSMYEWFADITLMFGLIPNHQISVIGVGWFLGVLFLFYLLFPFFCFLIHNKKRMWLSMVTSILLNVTLTFYFKSAATRSVFIYCSMFFVMGGVIYQYRELLEKLCSEHFIMIILMTIASMLGYHFSKGNIYLILIMVLAMVISGLGSPVNRVGKRKWIRFLSGLSLQIYLCHMFVFRTLEKLNLQYILGNGTVSYIVTSILTLSGAIVFAYVLTRICDLLPKKIELLIQNRLIKKRG